jgi:hypothetical protein
LFVLCPAVEVIGDVDHGLMITTVLEIHMAIMPRTGVSSSYGSIIPRAIVCVNH